MSEISVTPPSKGDPITAAWAARLTAAANAAQYGSADPDTLCTPNGVTAALHPPREMDAPPSLPAPFTVRLVDITVGGATTPHAIIYAPDGYDATGEAAYVYLGANPCKPNISATNASAGWCDLGTVPNDGVARYVVLGFNSQINPSFDIALQTSRRAVPSGCIPGLPAVVLARVCLPTPDAAGEVYDSDGHPTATAEQMESLSSDSGALGVVQFRSGALVLPDYGLAALDCAVSWADDGNGGEAAHLLVHTGGNAISINGVSVALDSSSMTATAFANWYDLGIITGAIDAWLVLDIRSGGDYADMTANGTLSPTYRVEIGSPPFATNIGNRPRLAPPILVWRGIGNWYSPPGCGIQRVRGTDIQISVPDSRNIRDDGEFYASVDWGTGGQTQLRGFESPTTKTGAQVAAASASLPVRFPRADGGAEVYYLSAANVAINDGGDLLFGGARYAPQTVTIDGQTLEILVKQ